VHISLFDYTLPQSLIAQTPAIPRDSSRLLVLDRQTGAIVHSKFSDIGHFLTDRDVLVLNTSKVFPARLFAKKQTGGTVEVFLLKFIPQSVSTVTRWKVMRKGKLLEGDMLSFGTLAAKVVSVEEKFSILEFLCSEIEFWVFLETLGHTPLPPYIHSTGTENTIREQYQTVYSKERGSVAAPTAGLHFTKELLDSLSSRGIQIEEVTLHVGAGTFLPIKTDDITKHKIHHEYFSVDPETVDRLNAAKKAGKRIISVGTTSTRVLETLATKEGVLRTNNLSGETNLFIYPPYKFNFVDGLITNFHLPQSSLLSLVSAFVSVPNTSQEFTSFSESIVGKAYQEAIEKEYRFYSFGDASLMV
jgi:S-adenosylmethionine:tRNA ribosyltransferase-isomerase